MKGAEANLTQVVDNVFLYIVGISVVLLVLVTGLMIFFAVRYNRRRHPRAVEVEGSAWLEILWTVIPTILVLSMFYFGYEGFRLMRSVPEGAMEVKVTGRMWDWSFEYPNGRKSNELYVPVGKPVKLSLKSLDVIHSFYIPAFRVKEDAVPGQENYLWFKPQTMGPADIYCAEYCGQSHAYMMSKVHVLSGEAFAKWYGQAPGAAPEMDPKLAEIFQRHGCLACHALTGDTPNAPGFRDLAGKTITVRSGETRREVVIDADYLRRAITEPDAEIHEGFQSTMPKSPGLTAAEVDAIVAFLLGPSKGNIP
ncbi:MAG: cytochrome c oxidase subunit II [Acidobacteria bacterium]|nr:cytochrome c oxidase subunit II [Acidobacteriota bacterium]